MNVLQFLAQKPGCALHPAVAATGTCIRCLRALCEACMVDAVGGTYCAPCVRKKRRWRTAGFIALPILVVPALAVGIWLLVNRRPESDSAAAPPPLSPLDEQLAREPCDTPNTTERVEQLMRQGERRAAISRAEAYFQRCGEDSRLRGLTWTSQTQINDWDGAIVTATKLIEQYPDDKDHWWWRGLAYEKKGDSAKAITDYRQSLAIQPALDGIPFNLANLYEKLATPCEAIQPIEQFLHYHPEARTDAVQARLTRLYASDGCAPLAGTGSARVTFPPGARVLRATVRINGQAGTFIVDTGASVVALTPKFAEKIGIDTSAWSAMYVMTAAGARRTKAGSLALVEVQGAHAVKVEAVLAEGLEGVDGLLGVSFLSRFTMQLDTQRGILTLTPRTEKP